MNMRNMALLGVVLFLLIALVTVMTTSSGTAGATEITYSEFQRQVDAGQIKDATIKGNKVTSVVNGQRQVTVFREMELDFASKLEDKFEGLSWEPAPVTGSPLIHDAVAHLDCDLHDQVTEGDHVVVIGRVRALEVHREEAGPLLFFRGAYGRHEPLG